MPGSYVPTNLPWYTGREDDVVAASTEMSGGHVIRLLAGATLKIGDAVFISAARTVNKSTTASDHTKRCGIVVGGKATNMEVVTDTALYDVMNAALVNEEVLVLISGICYVIADGTIGAGDAIAPSTTLAGRVRPATAVTSTIGTLAATKGTLQVGADSTPVTSTAANGDILTGAPALTGVPGIAGDGFSRILGHMLDSATIGQIKAALITLA
jgi:hypothetical protein